MQTPLTPNEASIAADVLSRLGSAWSSLTKENWDDHAVKLICRILKLPQVHSFVANVSRSSAAEQDEHICRLAESIATVTPTIVFPMPRIK